MDRVTPKPDAPVIPDRLEEMRQHSLVWSTEVDRFIRSLTDVAERHAHILVGSEHGKMSAFRITEGAIDGACKLAAERTKDELYHRLFTVADLRAMRGAHDDQEGK